MAGFASVVSGSDSETDYGYDLTASDEELLFAIADRLSAESPRSRPVPATPATPAPRSNSSALARNAISPTSFSPGFDPDESQAIDDTIAAITDDDLTFDISELQDDDVNSSGQGATDAFELARGSTAENQSRRLIPSVSKDDDNLGSFVSKTKPRTMPTLLPGPDVIYPDLSRALSDAERAANSSAQAKESAKDSVEDNRAPLLRFRTIPMKPLSVSDLTAGAWCELQYFYTLTRLPGGRKTRTAAMKRGTDVHETLERQVFTPVQIQVTKKEDTFGLRIWNIIQGLRVLREQGFTRELEVWGMVDGNVVNGVIDSLSYENPDPELQEDVLSSRGSSQTITNSQPYEPSTPGDYAIYITDVKTRNSATPPPQMQVRGAIIQLFLYHRFLSEMASDKLDYISVFERYGVNPDEPFSDAFMAQIGAVHDEVFVEPDDEADSSSDAGFVSAPSSPSQVSFLSDSSSSPTLRYRSLRTLLTLLKSELRLTFPRGASDLGNIVAVEYRYRGCDPPAPRDPLADEPSTSPDEDSVARPRYETGSVICVNTFFVEPETLDLYLAETMRWWNGEREPHGVALEEAAFKCRSCEFREECDWRRNLDQEALRKARRRKEKKKEEQTEIEVTGEEVTGKRRKGRRAGTSAIGDVYA
ncbi:exonuclease V [Achaetomium macrosporum]|uniref:Exonuclease V n=1 Tax=Achaetomium macrosporum TaxID=79813 RepID=A0AAN7CEX4_9PEZI|nr:exonuclease V [Achaetomium macrosporum]